MTEPRQLRIRTVVTYVPAVASALVALMAMLVLVGWVFDIELFKSLLHPQHIAMNPMTAVSMLLLSASLFVLRQDQAVRSAVVLSRVFAVLVLLVALLKFCDIGLGTHLGVDHLLFRGKLGVNEMSPNTALAFVLLAAGVLAFDFATRDDFHPAQIVVITAGCIGLLSLTGYLYRTTQLYGIHGFIPISLNSTLCFVALSLGFLCARPKREPLRSLLSDTLGGVVARRLIPAAFLVPLVAGKLQIVGAKLGLYDSEFGLAVLVLINILVFNILIWWCANAMRISDVRRRISEDALRSSDERNRAIMEQAAEGIFLVDLDTKKLIDANLALERILGYARGEARDKSVYDIVDDTPESIDSRLKKMIESDVPLHGQRRYKRKDGSTIDVETSAGVISFGGRRVVCSAVHDITQRKKAEEALNAERNLLRTLIDNIPDSIFIKDASGRYITCNLAHARFAGMESPEKIVGKTVFDLHPPEIAKLYDNYDRAIRESGKPLLGHEEFITDSEGNPQWALVSKIPICDAKGAVTGMVGITRDITRQKKADEQLATERNLLRTVIDNLPERIYVKDLEGKYVLDNAAHLEHLKLTDPSQVVGKSSRDLFPPEVAEQFEKDDQAVLQSGKPLLDREELSRHDSTPVWLLTTKVPLTDTKGQLRGLVGMSRDITARKRAEEILRQSEEKTRMIVETAQDAFISMDADGKITGWNAEAVRTFGWTREQAVGRVLAETIVPPQYRELHSKGLAKYLQTGEGAVLNQRIEISALHRDGHEFPVELSISPLRFGAVVSFNAFVHDISERKRAAAAIQESNQQLAESVESEREAYQKLKSAQSQLVQSEKLAGLGQMVAGVAHEINNPLSFVSNNVAVLQRDIRGLSELLALYAQADAIIEERNQDLLAQIKELAERMDLKYTQQNMRDLLDRSREGLRRIQQIVKDLRDFARLDESDLHEVDLNAGIQSTVNIVLGKAKKKRVQVEMELGGLPMVCCYPAKINQVVMNLVSNAIDASPEGGKVVVSSASEVENIRITVRDQGHGVPAEIRGRIFDPFFTTKPIGEGTGLGLSISYGIMQDHGGTISIGDAPGGGAMFTVVLPKKCPIKPSVGKTNKGAPMSS